MLAASPAELVSRFDYSDEEGAPLSLARLPGRRALAGERPPPLTVRYRSRESAEERWSRVQSTPVFDADGSVRLAINVIEDITDIKRAEHGPPVPGRGQPRAGGVARLPGDAARGRPARGPRGRRLVRGRPRRRRRHRARRGRARGPGAARARARDAASATRPTRARTRASSACCGTAGPSCTGRSPTRCSSRRRSDPEHLEILRSVGLRSAMLAPMTLRDRVLGVISVRVRRIGPAVRRARPRARRGPGAARRRRGRERAPVRDGLGDLGDAPVVAAAAGAARAAAAWRSPPPTSPRARGLEVGGDFYDVFNTAEDQWYAVIGDVCGKGAEAAAVTALARYTIRAAAVRRRSPSAILRWLSDAMIQQSADGDGRFCTIACAHLDLSRSPARVTVACGGHPLPLVVRAERRRRGVRDARDAARPGRAPRPPGPLGRAAQRRHARALHRRADRGRRAGARVGAGGARGRRVRVSRRHGRGDGQPPARRRDRRGPGRRATTSRCWRCARQT